MATPPSSAPQFSWQGHPERDLVIYRLIEVAHDALDEYFADDEHRANYQKRMRRTKGNKQKAAAFKAEVLEHWQAGEDNSLILLAQPDKQQFSMTVEGENFKADVAVTYDPDPGDLLAATVVHFEGNAAAFLAVALSFTDELSDLDLDDADLEDFLLPVSESRFPATKPNDAVGPAVVTKQDKKQVTQLAKALALDLKRDTPIWLESRAQTYLEAKPHCLWPILDGFLTACQAADGRNENLVAAYQWLLANQLELIRYRTEHGWAWADEMIAEYQQRIMEIGKSAQLSPQDLFVLAAALTEAKIPLNPKVGEAFFQGEANALEPASLLTEPSAEVVRAELQPLIDGLGEGTDNPFMVVEGLSDVTKLMPPGFHAFLVHEFALSSYLVLRDTVPLMLLDAEAEVRRAAAAALEQMAAPDTLSPVALRRAIILRNWIPEDERAGVDRAIKKARTKGVTCAQWMTPPPLAIFGMPIDGSGAHGLILTTKLSKANFFGGFLLKQNFGIRDIWCDEEKPQHEITQALSDLRRQTALIEVERDYLDLVLQHHLAIGLSNGHLPTPVLLAIAEAVGAAEWRCSKLDTDAEIVRLASALTPAELSPAEIAASLKRSGQWLAQERFAESWFEDDAEVASVVAGSPSRKGDAAVKVIFETILEKRRGLWTERFLLMALWAHAAKAKKEGKYWRDFLILARELSSDRALNEIPIMAAIAHRTIALARSGVPF